MSWMIEAYVSDRDGDRTEETVRSITASRGGTLTFREVATANTPQRGVCLTLEFTTRATAEVVAEELRGIGVHVEGPCDY